MKLWLLRPAKDLDFADNPWDPFYAKVHGFVIRAETKEAARQIADHEAGHEKVTCPRAWLDSKYSYCVELRPEGEAGVIIQDFMEG